MALMGLELIQRRKFQRLFGSNGVTRMALSRWAKYLMADLTTWRVILDRFHQY